MLKSLVVSSLSSSKDTGITSHVTIAILSTTTAVVVGGVVLFRRRLSSKWIDMKQRKRRNNHTDNGDLSDRGVYVITGGNTGLGYETAIDLAHRKASVLIGCRNTVAGENAVNSIKNQTKNNNVHFFPVDLSSFDSIRLFAEYVVSNHDKVGALICNAGVWFPMDKKQKTIGTKYEIHFGVNHMGHFVLIRHLLEHLTKQIADTRIVIVSSTLMKQGRIDILKRDFVYEGREQSRPAEQTEPEGTKNTKSKKKNRQGDRFAPTGYCDSKLMNVLCCRYLASDILKGTGITSYAISPGFCRSELGRNVDFPWYLKLLIAPVMLLIQRTATQGAQNIIFGSIENKTNLKNGGFYTDGAIEEECTMHAETFDREEIPKKLWKLSEELFLDASSTSSIDTSPE